MRRLRGSHPLAEVLVLSLNFGLTALLLTVDLPALLRVPIGAYLVLFSTGLVAAVAVRADLRSWDVLIAVPVVSWAAAIGCTVLPYFVGVTFSFRHVLIGVCLLQLMSLLGALPAVGRLLASRPPPVEHRDLRPSRGQAGRGALTLLGFAAVGVTLWAVDGTQHPQGGLPYSILQLTSPHQDIGQLVHARRGSRFTIPIELTSSRRLRKTDVTATIGERVVARAPMTSTGPCRLRAAVPIVAPATPGRHRVTLTVADPTYVHAPAPHNPADTQGRAGEAVNSAKQLNVTVWVIVR